MTPNLLQKTIQRLAATRPAAAVLVPLAHRLDRLVLRLSGGRTTAVGLLAWLPLVTLTTIGAKSGQLRSVPLVGIPDGEQIILVASNFGQGHHPAWYYNLVKNPFATLAIEGVTRDYRAREVTGEEYARCWQRAVSLYAGYTAYKTRAGGRPIPIMLLSPQSPGSQLSGSQLSDKTKPAKT